MRRRTKTLVRGASVLVAVAALGVGLWIHQRQGEQARLSDVITRPAEELAPGAQALLPNLHGAYVIVPDRPHDPAEVRDPDARAQITRTRSFSVSTSAQGLRGPAPRNPAGRPRIVCAGDSVTFGWGVEESDSWPRKLEVALSARWPEVEVVNGGVPARTPDAMGAWLASDGTALHPDLVIFARRPDHRVPDPIGAYVRALNTARAALGQVPIAVVLPPISLLDPDGMANMEAERSALEAALAPIPLLDLTAAFRAATPAERLQVEVVHGRQRLLSMPSARVLAEGAAPEHGLAPQITAAFEADPALAEPLFFDGGHPDAPGYALFAVTVARWLESQGLLPGARSARPDDGAPPQ